ncbi:hypothetical protein EK21DRAFT_94173 [Setomelanomma holmii]|uniref:F-box domain-containing protein n=1 Tax=Setomelanomma holmii TaxID=210430 RepID=A0A9P4GX57_9PLEO|nr:hypothetical protein EK21DRAFT_94173 [Setomelanomma holmii]
MASLLGLPLELLVAVSSHLTTPDLGALRLTCKQVEKSLYEWFAGEFFTKKQFMLTCKSLQAFIDISKHVGFSNKLTHVIIATNAYMDIPLRFRDSEAAERYIQGAEDQKALLSTGVVREMLTEAFQNLENLHTVGIRDFNNGKRRRDGLGASWSSWGATTVYKETGIELQFAGQVMHGIDFTHRAYQNLIYALGKAGRAPQELEVLLRRSSLPDSAFRMPDFLQPVIDPVLGSLKTLLLRVDVISRSMHTHTNGTSVDMKAGEQLRSFLGRTPNLEHLRLNLQKYQITENEEFLGWLGRPAPAPGSQLLPVSLRKLRRLELGHFTARPEVILRVIVNFSFTLEDLSLWRMTLTIGTGIAYASNPNLWADVFTRMTQMSTLKLKSMKAGFLSQDHVHVQFKDPEDKDAQPQVSKEYAGKKMATFLQKLVNEVFVLWLPEVVHDDDDEDEDEDEDEAEDMVDEEDELEEDENGDDDDE